MAIYEDVDEAGVKTIKGNNKIMEGVVQEWYSSGVSAF